ncbi:MAG: ATP-dependent helicase, partial [Oscillospiraceae bacterium]|nr:ATP-dependent helicase [Oscillospiraceae bacterium]
MRPEEFDKLYCNKLNPQQLEAVHSVDGPVLLLAVPGSGKTTVLVTRLGYMVLCRNIPPRSILTMTYTKAATEEMLQRFGENFGHGYARDMEICTINSLATQIISFYARHHGRAEPPQLIENEEAVRIISGLYQQINGDYATDSAIKDIRTAITYIKNMMLPNDEIETLDMGVENLDKLYQGYSKALKQGKYMDFDDQLSYALTILKRYPPVLEYFQTRFPYICVDEAQDTSKIQHEIIKLLAGKNGNIFMVGDEDQSIYGFRAAYPEALLNFEQDYSDARILLMEQNYRSSREIVAAADAFIAKNEHRRPKKLHAARGEGKQIQCVEAQSRSLQYAYLFEVGRLCCEETAILYRNNDSALPLIDMFLRRGVSYNCKKFEESFFTHRVVMDIRDIISFAYEPKDAELFLRIYYKLGFPISRTAAELACSESRRTGNSIADELCRSSGL